MLVKSDTADSTSFLEFNMCVYVYFYYLKLIFIFYFSAGFSFLPYLSHRFWKDSGVAVFFMENSKLRLNFVEQSSNDALCLPNSVCHQVHCNTINSKAFNFNCLWCSPYCHFPLAFCDCTARISLSCKPQS